jgi:hypothetical protein
VRIAVFCVVLILAAVIGAVARSAQPLPSPVVTCGDVVGQPQSGDTNGYRVVLGVISVAPAYLGQVQATHSRPWSYQRKAPLASTQGASRSA